MAVKDRKLDAMAEGEELDQQEAVQTESRYTANELVPHAMAIFGASRDIAEAALSFAGVELCTINEARKIIQEFAERKVM